MTATSVFQKYEAKFWPYEWRGQLTVSKLVGTTPADPAVVEAWLRKRTVGETDDDIRAEIAAIMAEQGLTFNEALKASSDLRHLIVFRRESAEGMLLFTGRQVKAAIKEAVSVAACGGELKPRGWGVTSTNKGIHSFVAEHVSVEEDTIPLGTVNPTGVIQSFPQNKRTGQTGIQYNECIDNAVIDFTVRSDWDFTEKDFWAPLWVAGQRQGIGGMRSQGYGRYVVTRWERTGS